MNGEHTTCASEIVGVVIYARGATITRRIALPDDLTRSACTLICHGVTPLADPSSLRSKASGAREIIGLQSHLRHPDEVGEHGTLRREVDALKRQREVLEALHHRALGQRRQLRDCALALRTGRSLTRDVVSRISDALVTVDLLDKLMAEEDRRINDLKADLEANARALEAARTALAQADAEASERRAQPQRSLSIQLAAGHDLTDLEVTYDVEAARWWPAYTVRLVEGATRATLTLEAFVAQGTGEDWSGVSLSLCTADMIRDATLPKLSSLRLGRSQPPARTGYRPPPSDLDQLFVGYDEAWGNTPQPSTTRAPSTITLAQPTTGSVDEVADMDWDHKDDELERRGKGQRDKPSLKKRKASSPMPTEHVPDAAPSPIFAAQASSVSMMPAARKSAGLLSAVGGVLDAFGGGGEGHTPLADMTAAPEPEAAIAPDMLWLSFEMLVLKSPSDSRRRGRLERAEIAPLRDPLAMASTRLDALDDPRGTRDPMSSRGRFDHLYKAEGIIDIPSTGLPLRVPLATGDAPCHSRFITVPLMSPEIYREIEMENPFASPLLSGPVDVFVDGALLRTSSLESVDRGGALRFGLGVEERLRVARNTHVNESKRGLLGGTSQIDHTITIEIASALGTPASTLVLDRLPVSDDKEIEVTLGKTSPEASDYEQEDRGEPVRGGLRWEVVVPAGGGRKIEFEYTLSLPSKREIVGGNRRD